MREENYFEKKLETSKETLTYTINELEHLDHQLINLQKNFDYNKGLLEQRVIQLQEAQTQLEKKIPELEKKLKQGYTCVDPLTGKGYKSFEDRHKAHLSELAQEAKDRYEERLKAYELKKRKGEIPKPVVEPPTGEVVITQTERAIQLLKDQKEKLEKQREELLQKQKNEKELIKAAKELEKAEKAEIIPEIPEIMDASEIPNALGPIDETLPYKEAELILAAHSDWIQEYADEEGGKAIWQGKITKGFKAWCQEKGYKLIE